MENHWANTNVFAQCKDALMSNPTPATVRLHASSKIPCATKSLSQNSLGSFQRPENLAFSRGFGTCSKPTVTRLSLSGEGTWADLDLENLSPQLNVFYGLPRAGKSSVLRPMISMKRLLKNLKNSRVKMPTPQSG